MKTLLMLSAIPASGKSTWAKQYAENHPNTYIVSSDAIRIEVTGTYNDHSRQKEVWELFSKRIHEYGMKEDCTVILDALNDINSLRIKYVKENPEFDKYILVLFPNDFERSKKFNVSRNIEAVVPEDILLQLCNKFEKPNEEVLSLFDEVITVEW